MRRYVPFAFLFLFLAIVSATFFSNALTPWYSCGELFDDLKHYFGFVEAFRLGYVPYRDFTVEYPPVSVAALMAIGSVSGGVFENFRNASIGFSLIVLVLMYMASVSYASGGAQGTADGGDWRREGRSFAVFAIATLSCGPLLLTRLDGLFALLTFWSVWLASRRKWPAAMSVLAVACGAKASAAVLVPLFALMQARQEKSWRKAAGAVALFLAVAAAALGSGWIVGGANYLQTYKYHFERGIEIGSLYGSVILVAKQFGLEVGRSFDHGSWNLVAGRFGDALTEASAWVQLGLLGAFFCAILAAAVRRNGKEKDLDASFLALGAFGLLLAFILGFKVGSPQFIIWLGPFLPAAFVRRGSVDWLAVAFFALYGHLQQWIFPWHWSSLVYAGKLSILALAVEKAVMILLLALCGLRLFQTPRISESNLA